MMSRGMRKRSLARMRAWQTEEKKWGFSGARLRRNILNGTTLWSQTPDTDWYRKYWTPPKGFIRLVATWPEEAPWLFEPGRSIGTLTGWGTEAYFVLENEDDRPLTAKEEKAVLAAMIEIEAPTVSEMVEAQAPGLMGLIETGCLTKTEVETVQKILESGTATTLSSALV